MSNEGAPSGRSASAGKPPRQGRDRFTAVLAALSLLGAGLALARGAVHGAALHSDSINYLGVARNLLSGLGFLNYDGSTYTLWPPLYPSLLAVSTLGLFDPLTVAAPLNAAAFGATIFVTGRYLRRRLRSPIAPFLVLWASLVLALSLPLGELAWWVLSGPVFVLLTVLALIQADRYLAEGGRGPLVWCCLLSALAWQARYIGIAVPAAVSLLLLLFDRRTKGFARVRRSALFFGAAAAPMALWFARNYSIVGGLTWNRIPVDYGYGEERSLELSPESLINRVPVDYELGGLLGDLVSGIAAWARFDLGDGLLLAAAAALPAAAFFVGGRAGAGTGPPRALRARPTAVFATFVVVYAVGLLGALVSGNTWHGVQTRFLAPLYAPLVIAFATALDRFLVRRRSRRPSRGESALGRVWPLWGRLGARAPTGLEVGAAVALSLWAAGQIAPNAEAVGRAAAPDLVLDAGYNAEPWKSSETVRYLRENEIPEVIHSNLPVLTYHHTWRRAASRSLRRSGAIGSIVAARNPRTPETQLRSWMAHAVEGAFVVWFRAYANRAFDYGPPQMRVTAGFEPVAELSDGVIFRVNREYRPAGNRYRGAWDAAASGAFGEPVAEEVFDLFLDEGRLIYAKQPCAAEEVRPRFLFHFARADPEGPPGLARESVFENRDFDFPEYGLRFGDRCLAIVPLPDDELVRLRTGQWLPGEPPSWQVSIRLDRERYRAELDAVSSGARGEPAARSEFDLYLHRGALTYLKAPCAREEVETPFFLHLYARYEEDLPPGSARLGFENRDFHFGAEGLVLDGKCVATVRLPAYPVGRLRTGQWSPDEGELWAVEVTPPPR